ncbi:hypothetical protein OUZ56_029494 [Daphnia magna]|uniref:Uncharacterized protein n=1 Tax=Daphnia magna TaxID=35525 RepID=A0ABR0B701_9CRUS|nr:hypothetical protein OUZ56_029494 [Daphnia magna]
MSQILGIHPSLRDSHSRTGEGRRVMDTTGQDWVLRYKTSYRSGHFCNPKDDDIAADRAMQSPTLGLPKSDIPCHYSFAGRAYGFRDFYGDQTGPY